MTITWRSQMSVDGGIIDHDHQVLIGIINEFIEGAAGTLTHAQLDAVLLKLGSYAATHFHREETLQLAIRYPYGEAHKREHETLVRDLGERRLRLAGADGRVDLAPVQRDIADFLRHWLVDHIIGSDLRMRPHAAALRQASRGFGKLGTAASGSTG
jgi:hemerythrin